MELDKSFINRMLFITALFLACVFVVFTIDVLLVILTAIIFSIPLNWGIDTISEKTKLKRPIGMFIAISLIILVFVGFYLTLAPSLSLQLTQFNDELSKSFKELIQFVRRYEIGMWVSNQANDPGQFVDKYGSTIKGLVLNASGLFSNTLALLFIPIVITILIIYFCLEPDVYVRGALSLAPPKLRSNIKKAFEQITYTIRWWFVGQCLSMFILGVLTTLLLWAFNIPLALLLGVLTASMTFIPNFGPIIAGIPTVVIAFTVGPFEALAVAIAYTILQQLEGSIITPLIHRKIISLPPALVISAQLILATLIGLPGLILAMPLTACLVATLKLFTETEQSKQKTTQKGEPSNV